MAKKKITDVVAELAGDFLAENGYELYNTEFVKEGRDWFLRVYIDKAPAEDAKAAGPQSDEEAEPQYVSTEDCEKVSRFLSEKLDEADPIEQNYYLEVSSPGMDRPLLRPEHFARYVGEEVEIRLYKAIDGVKNIQGVLESFDEEMEKVTVRCPQQCGKTGQKPGGKTGQKPGGKAGQKPGGKKAEPKPDRVYELQLSEIAKANLAVVF
ncbi:MAG: ribosome maturation factor RimP [Bacillota bacterium]